MSRNGDPDDSPSPSPSESETTSSGSKSSEAPEQPDWSAAAGDAPEAEPAGQAEGEPGRGQYALRYPPPGQGQILPWEAFHQLWEQGHRAAGQSLALETVRTAPDRAGFEDASRALYDTILDVAPWLLEVSNKWFIRAGAILAYAVPLAMGVSCELRERRQPAATAPEAEPAGEPAGEGLQTGVTAG